MKRLLIAFLILIIAIASYGATRVVAPNGDGEGALGDPTARWGNLHSVSGTVWVLVSTNFVLNGVNIGGRTGVWDTAYLWVSVNSNGLEYVLSRTNIWDNTTAVGWANFVAVTNVNLGGKWLSHNGTNNGILISTNRGMSVGIGTGNPLGMLHVYGTNNVASDFESYMYNSIVMDGVPDGDKEFVLADNGVKKWSDYIYRNENGTFKYWYNWDAGKDLLVASRTGRFGLNKQPNTINYHTLFSGTGLNDCEVNSGTSLYTLSYLLTYRITIDGSGGTNDTFKIESSTDNATYTVVRTGALCTAAGSVTNIGNGIDLRWSAKTGHTLNDFWKFRGFPQLPQGTLTVGPMIIDEVLTQTNLSVNSYNDQTFNGNSTDEGLNFTVLQTGTNSALYLGVAVPIDGVYANITTPAVGALIISEYWNGAIWKRLTSATNAYNDGTANFSLSGPIQWTSGSMSDWSSAITVDTYTNLYYWIRFRSTNTVTTAPIFSSIVSHGAMLFALYNSFFDASPSFYVDPQANVYMQGNKFSPSMVQTFTQKFWAASPMANTALTASAFMPFTTVLYAGSAYSNTTSTWYPNTTNLVKIVVSMQSASTEPSPKGFITEFYQNGVYMYDLQTSPSISSIDIPHINYTHYFYPSSVTNGYSIGVRRLSANVIMAGGNTNWWYGAREY